MFKKILNYLVTFFNYVLKLLKAKSQEIDERHDAYINKIKTHNFLAEKKLEENAVRKAVEKALSTFPSHVGLTTHVLSCEKTSSKMFELQILTSRALSKHYLELVKKVLQNIHDNDRQNCANELEAVFWEAHNELIDYCCDEYYKNGDIENYESQRTKLYHNYELMFRRRWEILLDFKVNSVDFYENTLMIVVEIADKQTLLDSFNPAVIALKL